MCACALNLPTILTEVESLGKVMGLTRNDECVHERKGVTLTLISAARLQACLWVRISI